MPTPAAGALALAFSVLMQDDGIAFEARVDKKNQVFVDVRNPTAGPVRVTTIRVSFFDADDRVIDRVSVDCDDDCSVAASSTESFGPIAGPRGWRNVRADDVQFKRMPLRPEAPGPVAPRPSGAAPPAPPPPPPGRPRVGRPGATDWASPEAVLHGFYVALNLGDLVRAREYQTRAANDRVTAAVLESWAKLETHDGTIIDLRLIDKLDEATGMATAEIQFADGAPAKRRVIFKREGEGWKIERVEPIS
jgi:hypothetical protein